MKIRKQADKWPHARESELGNRGNFCSWNPESWRSGIRNSAQGRGNLAHDCNPKSKFHWQRIWNPECTSYNPESKTVVDSLTEYDFFGEGKGGGGVGAPTPRSNVWACAKNCVGIATFDLEKLHTCGYVFLRARTGKFCLYFKKVHWRWIGRIRGTYNMKCKYE